MSGWTTVTAKANSPEDAEELTEAFEAITERDSETRIRDDTEVRVLDWGYGSEESMRILKRNADLWSEAIVMECNDTADTGHGTYYTSDGTRRGVTKEHSASGAPQARGQDAAHELRGKAGFRPFMR